MKKATLFFFVSLICSSLYGQIISTVAGNGISGCCVGNGGPATSAELNNPEGRVIFDSVGNMFWADGWDGKVRKVDLTGIITIITGAGSAYPGDGGPASNSSMYHVSDVAFDKYGNMFTCDNYDATIRKINVAGVITTIAGVFYSPGYSGDGGPATSAQIFSPNGVTCDVAGNVYITSSNSVRKINISTGIITTVVGDSLCGYSGDGGLATLARLCHTNGVTFDSKGNMFITDSWNNVIRKVDTAGIITTVVGNGFGAGTSNGGFSGDGGPALLAELNCPEGGVAFDTTGNMFIADNKNNRIRKVDTAGIITTIAGTGINGFSGDGGSPLLAQLYIPSGIAVDENNDLYISDEGNHRIRKISNDAASVKENKNLDAQVSVYPNPAATTISLKISNPLQLKKSNITIQNAVGEEIKKIPFTNNLDVSDLNSGIYFLTLSYISGETYKAKFIKQ